MVETGQDWPYKLLDRERHGRLVDNLSDICEMAGVPLDMIDRSMLDCGSSELEVEWVRGFNQRSSEDNQGGLLLTGAWTPDPSTRFMAMAAAFIRNFIDARVLHLFSMSENDDWPDPTVLIVPDFCRSAGKGGHTMPHWRVRQLQSMIMDRFTKRRATILHVESTKQLEMEHGKAFHDFLDQNWDVLKNN